MIWPFGSKGPRLNFGIIKPQTPLDLLLPLTQFVDEEYINTHKHVMGVSGMGKSKFLESLWMQLHSHGAGVSFIDPHSDSVEEILKQLIAQGYFQQPGAFDRLLFVEFVDDGFHIPWNILKQPHLASYD